MKTPLLFCLGIFLMLSTFLSAQEDCATALPIPIGGSSAGDNTGSLPDIDYTLETGCSSALYNSAIWFTFTTGATLSSVDLTFTATTISNATITIIDDCAFSNSYSYLMFICNANAISGVSQTICDLNPNTIYYIQVSTPSGDEGTFTLDVQPDLFAPSNDVCETAIVLFGGELNCGDMAWPTGATANTCGDYESTGTCFPVGTPGVWYTFSIPANMPYSMFLFNPVPAEFELYSSTTGCDNLNAVLCGGGFQILFPTPGATYYLLANSDLNLSSLGGGLMNDYPCNNPITEMDTGNGTGEEDLHGTDCATPDPILPCQNDHVIWFSYTVGCYDADLLIEILQWPNPNTGYAIDEGAIIAVESDCSTIMSQYDMVNGTGYVCSGIIADQDLDLSNVPAGTTFLIGVGSDGTMTGSFQIIVNETPVNGVGLINDDCPTAIAVNAGLNPDFHNNCSTQDILYPTCTSQNPSTVWFMYDPSPNLEDVIINIISTGIISPAIAVYDNCVNGNLLGEICGTSLSLQCLDVPIFIEIGSADANTGNFDLEIVTSPSSIPPSLTVTNNNICSDEPAGINLGFPAGIFGDIIVTVHSGSSPDINGMTTHNFVGVNSATIGDILENCGTSIQDGIYSVETNIPGFSCPSLPVDVTISVHPKLIITPLTIEDCLPFNATINAADVISGGTTPYMTYNWLWNGSVINTSDLLNNYPILQSGVITLQVTDAANCFIETDILVTAHTALNPLLLSDATEACPGDPQDITFTVSASTGGPIISNTWNVLDPAGNATSIGQPLGNMFVVTTNNLDPGSYTISVLSTDINGCQATSNDVILEIFPSPNGEIVLTTGAMCSTTLDIQFYGPGGTDDFNNGPDSNGDGIPDILDINNDGIPDINDIIWTTPPGDIFNTGLLSFTPTQGGIHTAEIITDNNCSILLTIDAMLPQQNPPTVTSNSIPCLGQAFTLTSDPQNYTSYSWLDANGVEIGTDVSVIVFPITSPITYTLETIDANGCAYSIITAIVSSESPVIQLTGSTSLCPGESTIVSVGQNPQWTYEWFDGSNTLLGSDSSSLVIDMAGNYTIIVSGNSNCADTVDFVIDENADLTIDIVGNDLCGNVSTTLDGGPGFDNYAWTNEVGNSLGSGQTIDVSSPGSYYLDVTLGMCNGTDTIEITQAFPPVINLSESASICNNAGNQSQLNFEDLVATSDNGNWVSLDLPASILDDLSAVDFDNVVMGTYTFVYTTNVAVLPCMDISATFTVNVSDCPCLNPDVEDLLVLCNTTNQFDLNDQLLSDTDPGVWTFGTGPQSLSIVGTTVLINGANIGTYEFIYTLDPLPSPGCQESDILFVEIIAPPEATFDDPTTLCNTPSMVAGSMLDLGSLLLSGSGNWIDPNINNLDFSDPNSLNFVGVNPGGYSIEFITNNAVNPCSDVIYNIEVNVIDCNCPFIDLQTPDDLCNNNGLLDLTLFEGISDPGNWTADSSNPADVTIVNAQVDLTGLISGIYTFTYTLTNTQQGCPTSDNITLELFAQPQITNSSNAQLCNDDSTGGATAINLDDLISADSGVWTDAIGAVITDPSNLEFAGLGVGNMYTFTFTTNTAIVPCDNVSVDVVISIVDCSCDDPVFLDPPALCNSPGESVDLNELVVSDHEGTWQIIDQPDGANSQLDENVFVVEYVVPGDYTLEFSLTQDPGPNCPSTFIFTVTIVDQLVADVLSEDDVCTTNNNGDQTTYNLMNAIRSGSDQGYWTDEMGNVITGPLEFLDSDPDTHMFTYVLENMLPCTQQQYILSLNTDACTREIIETGIYIPNVFSPNGDNLNDIFFIQSNISDITISDMFIFDRWGERVFYLSDFPVNDPLYGWNGEFKGTAVVPGVYQYLIDAIDAEGVVVKLVGDITVVQ